MRRLSSNLATMCLLMVGAPLLIAAVPFDAAHAAPKKNEKKNEKNVEEALKPTPAPAIPSTGIVLDAIVASVDDKAVTLSELCARLSPPRKLSLKEAAADTQAQQALDAIILEKLIDEEAQSRKVNVSDSEIEEYVNEVARRNNLSRPEFEQALKGEGREFPDYRRQVRYDILKSKLMSAVSHGGVSVSEGDVDQYIKDHPELVHGGRTLKLRQIIVDTTMHPGDEAGKRVDEIVTALDGGQEFSDVAKKFSDGSEAADGGLIGTVAEKDLSPETFDAVLAIDEGEHTKPITMSNNNIHIFLVEKRFVSSDDDSDEAGEDVRAEARRVLQQQRTQEKISSYFVSDLYKTHVVDKKI